MNYTATKRLYLTADRTRVVDVASHEAGYLFRAAGHVVTQEEVDKYGLEGTGMVRPVNQQPKSGNVEKAEEAPEPEDKAVTEAPDHKAVLSVPEKKTKGKKG
jgi:hypothetical protein